MNVTKKELERRVDVALNEIRLINIELNRKIIPDNVKDGIRGFLRVLKSTLTGGQK